MNASRLRTIALGTTTLVAIGLTAPVSGATATRLKDAEGRFSHHARAGWMSPWQAGWINLKAMFVFLLVTWIRWSFVRIRVDQILAISWKLLLPASLLLLMATAVVVVLRGPGG